MTIARPVEESNLADRLQAQKHFLAELANRAPVIESEGIEAAVLEELELQLTAILNKSEKRLRELIAKIKDDMDSAEMEALEIEIKSTLETLTDTEAQTINKAYENSMAVVTLNNELTLELSNEQAMPAPPIADQPKIVENPEPSQDNHWATFFTQKITQKTEAFTKAAADITQKLAVTEPTSAPKPLTPKALQLKAEYNKRTILFPSKDEANTTPVIDSHEKAVEASPKTVQVKRTSHPRKIDSFTPKKPTQAN